MFFKIFARKNFIIFYAFKYKRKNGNATTKVTIHIKKDGNVKYTFPFFFYF